MPAANVDTHDTSLHVSEAVSAALAQNWKEAIRINMMLVERDGTNIDTLNRLGYAFLKTGNVTSSKLWFTKVLTIDPYNQIALKNIKKLTSLKKKYLPQTNTPAHISPLMFLEEPGKTKIVNCVNPAPEKILSTLNCGQEVFMKAKKHCVEVRDEHDTYLAALPDDLSFKLIKFLKSGNSYRVVIKGIGKNSLMIFLREMNRGKRFANQPSFSTTTSYIPFSRVLDERHTQRPDTSATGENDEEPDSNQETLLEP